jgi:hypothetical protein
MGRRAPAAEADYCGPVLPGLSILMPAYNEARTIASAIGDAFGA